MMDKEIFDYFRKRSAARAQQAAELQMTEDEMDVFHSRQRFHNGPIGHWSSASGTFGIVMSDTWEFRPDGTGTYNEYGPFGGSRGETQFDWKSTGDCQIACKITSIVWTEDDETEKEADEEETISDCWVTVDYDFQLVNTDGGAIGAMCSVHDGKIADHFWISFDPASYSGPIS
ncbi:MAG: hypothetical protein ABIY70_01710 [Capsulimonas sp.]|uniref:hypothetical protein n=1 Tax=Capsulimonas sp. TaxID=2494211 RepID=UPI0032645AD2